MAALRSSNLSGQPRLRMIIEPESKFRFRYASDGGSHGGIPGKKSGNIQEKAKNKIFPTVKLENYHSKKPVKIRVSLLTDDRKPHVLQLVGKHVRENGMCYQELDKDFTAKFTNLIIRVVKKEEAHKMLMDRKIQSLGGTISVTAKRQLEIEVKERAKKILNSAVLCFEAFMHDNPGVPICEPLYSKSICNQKTSLRILRISHYSGSCMGDEEVIILCDHVKKEAIQVLFFERGDDDDSIIWERKAKFSPADVHYQVAIPFKTPPYKENTERKVSVCLCQNNERSESVEFLYTAEDESPPTKRKLRMPSELENSSPSQLLNDMPGPSFSEHEINNIIQDHFEYFGLVGTSEELNAILSMNVTTVSPDDTSSLFHLDDTSNLNLNFGLPEDTSINTNMQIDSIGYARPPYDQVYNQSVNVLDLSNSEFLSDFHEIPHVFNTSASHGIRLYVDYMVDQTKKVYEIATELISKLSLHKFSLNKKNSVSTKKKFCRDRSENEIHYGQVDNSCNDPLLGRKFQKKMPYVEEIIKTNKWYEHQQERIRGEIVEQLNKNSEMKKEDINFLTKKEDEVKEASEKHLNDKIKVHKVCMQLLSRKDVMGNTLLHLAVLHNRNVETILKMIKFSKVGIVNKQNNNKQTAIHLATEQNNTELIKLLCLNGANPHVKNGDGDNCFHIAACKNAFSCLAAFHQSRVSGVDDFNYEGLTPLHIVVMKKKNCERCLHLLLQMDANVNVQDKKAGRTPLHYTVEMESNFIFALLQEPNIDVNCQDFSGDTPLHLACSFGLFSTAWLLLEAGADPLIKNFKRRYQVSDEETSEDEFFDCPTPETLPYILEEISENTAIDGQTSLDMATHKNIIELLTRVIKQKNVDPEVLHSGHHHDDITELLQSEHPPIEENLLQPVEAKMCHSLDVCLVTADWNKLVMCLGMDDYVLQSILTSNSPSKVVVSFLKRNFKERYICVLENALEVAELYDGKKIVQEMLNS